MGCWLVQGQWQAFFAVHQRDFCFLFSSPQISPWILGFRPPGWEQKYIAMHLKEILTLSNFLVALLTPVYKSQIFYTNIPINRLHTFLSLLKWVISYWTSDASILQCDLSEYWLKVGEYIFSSCNPIILFRNSVLIRRWVKWKT